MSLFDPSNAKVVPAHELAEYEVSEEDLLIKPGFLIRGTQLLLSGATEVGKSWICLNMIRALVLGEDLFGNPEWPTRKCSALYIESEVGITMPGRIKKVFQDVDLGSLDFYCLQGCAGFDLIDYVTTDWLRGLLKERQFDVVVLDPLGDLAMVEESNALQMVRLLRSIRELQGRAAIVMSHHFRKPPSNEYFKRDWDPLDINNNRGVGKLGDSISTALTLARRRGRLNPRLTDDSWILDARWAKTRHAKTKPEDGTLLFNQNDDGRMIWTYGTIPEEVMKQPAGWS